MSVTDGGNDTNNGGGSGGGSGGADDNGAQNTGPASGGQAVDQPVPGYKRKSVWLRGLFMLLFMIFFEIGEWLLGIVAVLQFLWLLFDRAPNENIKRFGQSLSLWLQHTARYQACATDEKPFPWASWPKPE